MNVYRIRDATPRAVALRLLAARFPDPPPDGEGARVFDLAAFQRDGARRAEAILATRRGVVIADGVGLGKTYIALALIERALRRGERVVVTTPAALRSDWTRPLRRLARELELPRPPPWLSHTRLSRGGRDLERLHAPDLVVADEAHAFRNPRTRRYRALARLCRGARVALLTATPVNNTVLDLYHLLRLFASDDAFRDLGVPDLRAAFQAAEETATADSGATRRAMSLRRVLGAVVIRRGRAFVREHYGAVRRPDGQTLHFPRRAPPVPVRYELGDDDLAADLDRLRLAALRPDDYGAAPDRRAGHAAELTRLLLLKRLESSPAAFHASVARQLRFHDAFLRALGRGRLLTPAAHRTLYDGGDADTVQLTLEGVVLRAPPPGTDVDRLRAAVRSDRHALGELHRRSAALARRAPKLARLRALLDGELAGEKVVVFTQFRDTARQLWRALHSEYRTARIDGAGAFLGARPCGRREALARFAPHANGAPEPPPRERVDLLIATDVLAEGLNLQDARRVVSYDLPWNPVRLIQRVGRVDRVGSPHAEVRAYHFLPGEQVDGPLGLLERLRTKLAAIGATVGSGGAVLGGSAAEAREMNAVAARLAEGDPGVLGELERRADAPFERTARLRAAYTEARRDGPERAVPRVSLAAAITAPPGTPQRVLLGYTLGDAALWLVAAPDGGTIREGEEQAAEILLRALDPDTHTAPLSRSAVADALEAARPTVRAHHSRAAASQALDARAPGVRAARRLQAVLAAVRGGPGLGLCRRADRVLDRLARRHDAGTEAALREVIDDRPDETDRETATALLATLEAVLAPDGAGNAEAEPPPAQSATSDPPAAAFIGAIEVRPRA